MVLLMPLNVAFVGTLSYFHPNFFIGDFQTIFLRRFKETGTEFRAAIYQGKLLISMTTGKQLQKGKTNFLFRSCDPGGRNWNSLWHRKAIEWKRIDCAPEVP